MPETFGPYYVYMKITSLYLHNQSSDAVTSDFTFA